MHRHGRPALVAAVLAVWLLGGCSEEPDPGPSPDSAFARALGTVGTGNVPVSTGFGWVHLEAVGARSLGNERLRSIAGALGPGGGDLLVERGPTERRTGVDPLAGTEVISVSASYTTGVRLEDIDGRRLEGLFKRSARARRPREGWTPYDAGPAGTVPLGSELEVFGALGSRTALHADGLILARSESARSDLLGSGESPLNDPAVRLAIACLGDVSAARIVPNNFTHLPNTGPELLAFGVRRSSGGAPREVLCAVDPFEEEIDAHADAMRQALAPKSVDAVTVEPIGELLADVTVDTLSSEDVFAARALLSPLGGDVPGFLFGAFDRGSLLTYIGLAPPPSSETSPLTDDGRSR